MKLIARHSDKNVSQWAIDGVTYEQARSMIQEVIMHESKGKVKVTVVLALVEGDFQ